MKNPSTISSGESDERAAFESDAAREGLDIKRSDGSHGCDYVSTETGDRWAGWLARAAESKACASVGVGPVEELLAQFECAAVRCAQLHREYLGKAMSDQTYDTFATLRDETLPALRKRLLAALASPAPSVGEPVAAIALKAARYDYLRQGSDCDFDFWDRLWDLHCIDFDAAVDAEMRKHGRSSTAPRKTGLDHFIEDVEAAETWRCFHCDECFTTVDSAIEHFGRSERQSPACQIDIAEYRAMELRMEAYNAEDADIHREMHAKLTDHQLALVREEERGYSRGLRDAKRNPEELGLQPIATPPAAPAATEAPSAEQVAHVMRLAEDYAAAFHYAVGLPKIERVGKERRALESAIKAIATPAPAVGASKPAITLDFKQAAELLEMFGGEPTEITLMVGLGHSGEGLYAVYNADPEGAVYLGQTDEDATPAVGASVQPAAGALPPVRWWSGVVGSPEKLANLLDGYSKKKESPRRDERVMRAAAKWIREVVASVQPVPESLSEKLKVLGDEAETRRRDEANDYLERIHLGMRDGYYHAARIVSEALATTSSAVQPVLASLSDEQIIDAIRLVPMYSREEALARGRAVLALASSTPTKGGTP